MSKLLTAWYNEKTDEIHLPKGRLVWPDSLLTAKAFKKNRSPDAPKKHSTTVLIPAAANLDVLKKMMVDVAVARFGQDWQKKNLRNPLIKSVDDAKLTEYAEAFPWFARTSTGADYPPFIFGPDAQRFTGDPSDIYSGRWAVVTVRPYAFDNEGRGISLGLQRVQLLDHDEVIVGGRMETNSGFDAVDVGAPASGGGAPISADDMWK
jgi:hypothetical protein